MSGSNYTTTMANTAPSEVLEQICQHLGSTELKTARLLCRSFQPVARKCLFSEVVIRTNLVSFKRLGWISRNKTLKEFVKKLIYDDTLMHNEYKTIESWLLRDADLDGSMEHDRIASSAGSTDRKPTGEPLPTAEATYHYAQYLHYIKCQERLLAGEELREWIAEICVSLPNLEAVELVSPGMYLRSRISQARAIGRETLVAPVTKPNNTERVHIFTSLARAAISSITRLKSITGRIPLCAFEELYCCKEDLDEKLGRVRCLSFDMDNVRAMAGNTMAGNANVADPQYCASLIAKASMLQKLHLNFEIPFAGWPLSLGLSTLLVERSHWPSLKDLRLGGLNCDEAGLKDFLLTHTATLKYLELLDIKLIRSGTPAIPSWISVIQFLSESLQLRYIRLDGRLVAPQELWITRDEEFFLEHYKDDPSYVHEHHPNDLRSRIERYILHGGQCPLKLPPSGSDLLHGFGDSSWYYSVQRLPSDR